MYKYHSIEQFRNCIKSVEFAYKDSTLPKLKFKGSVKLHGTNAGVELPSNTPQSRNQVLTESNTNMGFFGFHQERKEVFQSIYESLGLNLPAVLYGEFAGKGIQQGVGISQVDKAFYLFGIKVITGEGDREHYWLPLDSIPHYPEQQVYNLHLFYRPEVEIDFVQPQLVQNTLVELTQDVEKECPVANKFGVVGIGEGIVWEHLTNNGDMLSFKVKGEKHSASKVRTLAEVDVVKQKSVKDFVELALSESRLSQGIFEVFTATGREVDVKEMGTYLKWVSTDVLKEEADTLEASGLTMRDVGSLLNKTARDYFLGLIN